MKILFIQVLIKFNDKISFVKKNFDTNLYGANFLFPVVFEIGNFKFVKNISSYFLNYRLSLLENNPSIIFFFLKNCKKNINSKSYLVLIDIR